MYTLRSPIGLHAERGGALWGRAVWRWFGGASFAGSGMDACFRRARSRTIRARRDQSVAVSAVFVYAYAGPYPVSNWASRTVLGQHSPFWEYLLTRGVSPLSNAREKTQGKSGVSEL